MLQLLGPDLFSYVGRSSWDLLHFPGQKAKLQDGSLASSICSLLFLLPTAPERKGATSSWEVLQ